MPRRSRRENGKVNYRTPRNLSHLFPDLIDTIRRRLAGVAPEGGSWDLVRGLTHGQVAAVLGSTLQIGQENALVSRKKRVWTACA